MTIVNPQVVAPITLGPDEWSPATTLIPSVTTIRPARGWQLINAGELWQFRELIFYLTWRDVKVRYKQTLLGAAWAILQPLLMMVVFTIFFGRMAGVSSGDLPYPLFAYAGLLPWTFFATAIAAAGNSVVGSERLITKIYFPRLAVPFSAVGAAVVDFVIAFGLLIAMMVYYRVAAGWGLLLVPAISVYMQVAQQPAAVVPSQPASASASPADPRHGAGEEGKRTMSTAVKAALALNPMTGLIGAFRAAVLGGPIPWGNLAASSGCALLGFFVGCFYFRRVEDTFADII